MAQARYSRIDNKRSPSSYCSTVTIVVFVALCLVGLWMMTSSVVPVQNVDESTKNEVKGQSEAKDQATDITNSNPQNFEDKKGDLPQESTKEDNNAKQSENNHVMPKKQEEKSDEKPEDKSPEDTKMTYIDPNQNKKTSDSDESNNKSVSDESNNKSGSGEDNKKSDSDVSEKKSNSDEREKKSNSNDNKSGSDASENKKDESSETTDNKTEEKADQSGNQESDESSNEKKTDENTKNQGSNELLPSGAQSELLNETTTQTGSFSTQAAESKSETESQKSSKQSTGFNWKLCNVTAGPDYIPCLDNLQAIRNLKTTKHYEHRERQCPEDPPTCLVALPEGYKRPIEWPKSREKIWYSNVPHTKLAEYKGHQNWVKVTGEYLTFPGGGTQFKHGALHYIDTIQQSVPDIAWGKQTRVILDVGCGVASFGGFLFERDVLAMSFAPKDEHEAQVQFALERGIPAISAVMGTKRLPFPARVFDAIHCARCRVPWHIEGGKLLLELNRVLRPGGFFVWSATPIYQKLPEDVEIWNEMKALTKAMCWEVVSISRDKLNKVGIAVYKKPTSNECYEKRSKNEPSICQDYDDPNAAWNIPLQTCMHKAPVSSTERGSQWPGEWPERLSKSPYWLSNSEVGVYGKPAPEDFTADHEHWKRVVSKSYLNGIGIQWSNVRNVMDMRSVYGGFAAALMDLKIWVMNVVPVDSPDTLPIIYERGLFGIYHDWCESFSTYPRSYDLVHADHLFSKLKKRCKFEAVVAEVDRILRPEGKLIVRDTAETINELESLVTAMQWESMWRPTELETVEYAIGSIPNSRQ
ncbi:putative S-adenosyl-L-methionine-dependent methyltransferase [Medicago truncatula]|uniref:Putative S-adenosyl-L-methionine-dependent methyltransferase n=1 Tax=Medicago truncatula TaxID=3880 RepID=A0A396GRY8_MEDTR|nr:putative S-adenosyl-L-methionine-dependent methyltransferase [Medicago truncatula]